MGLERIILERKRGSIAMETSTYEGRKTFVLRRGWIENGEWKYRREGINFNKTSFSWLLTNLATFQGQLIDFFDIPPSTVLTLPESATKPLTGTSYRVIHDNAKVKVEIDTVRNPSMKNADQTTLTQALNCLDNALHEYFDERNEEEINRFHSLMANQLKAAQWR